MSLYSMDEIRTKITELFLKAGLSKEASAEISEQLLYAEMRGIESHGLIRIKWILEQIHKYPNSEINSVIKKDTCELYDGNGVLGYLALSQITNQLPSAANQTIKMIGIQNTYPTGALAYFSEKLAQKGWISLMSSSSPRRVGLSGDNMAVVGTDPWTFGLPVKTPLGGYVVADTSLAELTHGQCLKLLSTGKSLPTAAASLPGGAEISSPQDFYKDGKWNAIIHPIGGQKSYKAFCIMWSIHMLAYRMLGLTDEKSGTFMVLLSPDMWDPAISREDLLEGFNEEIQLMQKTTIVQVPGLDRRKRLQELKDKIKVTKDVASILSL